MITESEAFQGFSKQTITFLSELSINNNKHWFSSNRQLFDEYVLKPMQLLVQTLGPTMLAIDSSFEIQPKIDKTISRIYRDIRFSNDKSPFRSAMWLTFKVPSKTWHNAPCYYFEISPSGYNLGMGFYAAAKSTMANLRQHIETNSTLFQPIFSQFQKQKQFTIQGETYKRLKLPFDDIQRMEWFVRKNIYFNCHRDFKPLFFTPKLSEKVTMDFLGLKIFYDFFKTIAR